MQDARTGGRRVACKSILVLTQRLQSSSFWVMTYFLLRDYNIQLKKELLWSLWVSTSYLATCTLGVVHPAGFQDLAWKVQSPSKEYLAEALTTTPCIEAQSVHGDGVCIIHTSFVLTPLVFPSCEQPIIPSFLLLPLLKLKGVPRPAGPWNVYRVVPVRNSGPRFFEVHIPKPHAT